MPTASSAYQTAVARTGYRPVYLVELVHANQYLATRPFQSGGPWRCGDGLVSGAPQATSGGQRPAYAATLASLGTLSVEADDQGRARVGNTTIEILNQDLAAGQLSEQLVLEHTLVRILQGFQGGGYDDYVPLMTGVIDRAEATWDALRLDVVDGSFRKHRDLSVPVGGQYFPGTPHANRGKAIPLLFGRNVGVRPIQVTGDAAGSLAFAMTASQDFADLTEFDAPFPPDGELSIGSETGITYSSRQLISRDGITYLRLGGLVRPAGPPGATTHAVDEAVTLTSVVYTYLIGYAVGELLAVRQAGVLLAPGAYTFTQQADGADRPVSLLTFTAPQDDLTVDVQDVPGRTISLTNGSFETGDASGWTATDASVSVTSGDTAEGIGAAKAELTADTEDTDGSLSQAFGTRPDDEHVLTGWYRDPVSVPTLETNGSFADGLTGWTIVEELYARIEAESGQIVMRFLRASGSARAAIRQDIAVEPAHTYRIRVSAYGSTRKTTATVAGPAQTDYVWHHYQGFVPYYRPTTREVDVTVWSRPRLSLGTPDAPGSYLFEHTLSSQTLLQEQFVTPTDATLRLTLHGHAWGLSLTPSPVRWFFVEVSEVLSTDLAPRITTSLHLGTLQEPTRYQDVAFDTSRLWHPIRIAWVPTTSRTQLTLLTQWHTLQQPSQFDRLAVHFGDLDPAGRHPIAVMRTLVRTFLPAVPIDAAAFDTAYAARRGWRVGAYLPDPGNSRALLETLGAQCATRVFENSRGELSLSVYDETRGASAALTTAAIVEDDVLMTAEYASTDTVYTTINVWWGKREGQAGQEQRNYQGLAYATPEETSSADQGLVLQCALAQRRYRRTQTLNVYADFLRDADTAHRLLAHLVTVHTVLRRTITCTTWLQAAPLDLYDVVDLQHPVVAGGRVLTCEVRGKRVNPAANTVELTLVELRVGDIDEEWNYDVVTFDDVPLDEEWEQ